MTKRKRGTTIGAITRQGSVSMNTNGSLPDWMYSPPTPQSPEKVAAGPDGKPPADRNVVVDCGGALYDQITLYRLHNYTPPATFGDASPILHVYLHDLWGTVRPQNRGFGTDTDARPENHEARAKIEALAREVAALPSSPALERRRMWQVIDWEIRTYSAAMLDLAGWADHAAAFRALPPITRPSALPLGAAALFRAVHKVTDKASNAALEGRRPYKRDRSKRGPGRTSRYAVEDFSSYRLVYATRRALPDYDRHVIADAPRREQTDLGRAVQAGSYARMCVDYDPRIPGARIGRVLRELAASGEELLREIIDMGKGEIRRAA